MSAIEYHACAAANMWECDDADLECGIRAVDAAPAAEPEAAGPPPPVPEERRLSVRGGAEEPAEDPAAVYEVRGEPAGDA